jgi:hypothetical protein
VAVLGSVMSSTYRPRVSEALAGLPIPQEAANAAKDQVGAALAIAERLPGPAGTALHDAAAGGFVDGMSIAFIIGAAALALGAILVAKFLPARAPDYAGPAGAPGEGQVPAAAGPPAEPQDAPVPEPQDSPVPVASGDGDGATVPVASGDGDGATAGDGDGDGASAEPTPPVSPTRAGS